MSTGTVQPAPSGLSFSQSIFPPRPSGPCVELSGWSRQLTRTELEQLRTAVHGVSAIQEIDKGARLLFISVPLLEAAVPILKTVCLNKISAVVSVFNGTVSDGPSSSPTCVSYQPPGPHTQRQPSTPIDIPSPPACPPPPRPSSSEPTTAIGLPSNTPVTQKAWAPEFKVLSDRIDATDARMGRLETKIDRQECTVNDIHELLRRQFAPQKGTESQSTTQAGKRKAASQGNREDAADDPVDVDEPNAESDQDSQNVIGLESFSPLMKEQLVGFVDKCVKNVDLFAVLPAPSATPPFQICRVQCTKARKEDMSQPDSFFCHVIDHGNRGWISSSFVYRDRNQAQVILSKLVAIGSQANTAAPLPDDDDEII